jgi:hypothetical protein
MIETQTAYLEVLDEPLEESDKVFGFPDVSRYCLVEHIFR